MLSMRDSKINVAIFSKVKPSLTCQFAGVFTKEANLTFPPIKTGTAHVNEEREKVSPINLSSNAEPGYSKDSQNEDLIN